MLSVWAATEESAEWIAERTDVALVHMSERLGIPYWDAVLPVRGEAVDGEGSPAKVVRWDAANAVDLVRRSTVSAVFESAGPQEGFSLSVRGRSDAGLTASVLVTAGHAQVGRRIPRHHASFRFAGGSQSAAEVGEVAVIAAATAFDPLMAYQSSADLNALDSRGQWKIPPSRWLWLREDVVVVPWLPSGMSEVKVGSGTLYVTSSSLSAETVVELHKEFRERNGIDVLPH